MSASEPPTIPSGNMNLERQALFGATELCLRPVEELAGGLDRELFDLKDCQNSPVPGIPIVVLRPRLLRLMFSPDGPKPTLKPDLLMFSLRALPRLIRLRKRKPIPFAYSQPRTARIDICTIKHKKQPVRSSYDSVFRGWMSLM
jgi:hypothetical protein